MANASLDPPRRYCIVDETCLPYHESLLVTNIVHARMTISRVQERRNVRYLNGTDSYVRCHVMLTYGPISSEELRDNAFALPSHTTSRFCHCDLRTQQRISGSTARILTLLACSRVSWWLQAVYGLAGSDDEGVMGAGTKTLYNVLLRVQQAGGMDHIFTRAASATESFRYITRYACTVLP